MHPTPDAPAIAAEHGGSALAPRTGAAILAAILVATAAAYVPAAAGPFHWDDELAVVTNPRVVDPSLLGWRSFVPPALGRDRPLTDLTFALNRALNGTASAPYVYTNVAIHLAAIVLAWAAVLAILRRAGHARAEPLALAVAALFALHPIQTEAVSFVSQRAESLASALCLGALLAAFRAEDECARGGLWRRWACGAAALAVAALAAKPIAVTFPVLLAALAWTRPAAGTPPANRKLLAAAIGVAVAVAVAAVASLRGIGHAGLDAGELGPWRYLLTEAWVVVQYVRLLFWPSGLSVDPAVRATPGLADTTTIVCVALVLGAIALGIRLAARGRRGDAPAAAAASAGLLWFFVLLAPTSSFVPLQDPMAEHRTYLANLGIFLAVAVGVDAALGKALAAASARRAAPALWVAAAAVLGFFLVERNRAWGDEVVLWTDAARKAPAHYRPHLHAGNALSRAGRHEEAVRAHEAAARLVPASSVHWPFVQRTYAESLAAAGRPVDARAVLTRAIAAAPSHPALREALAWSLYAARDHEGALAMASAVRALSPESADAAAVSGKIAVERGDLATGLRELRRAADLAPRSAPRRSDLAIAAWMVGRKDDACAEIARFVALEREPGPRAEGVRVRREWGCPGQ